MLQRSPFAILAVALSGTLAACGAASPPTPGVRIIMPPTRTPWPASATPVPVEPGPSPTAMSLTPTVTATATAPPALRSPLSVMGAAAAATAPMGTRASATAPKPSATRTAACASVTFDELRKKGPRPAVLDAVADGGCVSVRFASGEETRYVWHPAGAQFAPGASMYVRWKDGMVAVFKKDGVLKTNEFYRGRQQELALTREDGKYRLPASGSFVFGIVGDDSVIGLVDTLVKGSNR